MALSLSGVDYEQRYPPVRKTMTTPATETTPTEITNPSAFMRGRRPALFSDSLAEHTIPLSEAEFEYQLETITARGEEAQFQRFIHALLEAEVCPNLLPQTGPTGGGDSKVDTETYQVSDATAARWWSGTARDAAQEDWAFAISAKKDWRQKARSDVTNVLASGRTYTRIHFATNQYVRDKDRDKVEKELKRQAGGIPVRIFDRSWIIQSVFHHARWDIAERELGLIGLRAKSPGAIGPRDADRARQLARVDAELMDQERFANSPLQLAHAWLTSALLARGLGRPREEVDQRFDRAIEAARRSGSARGLRRMLYQKTWTDYWWFDDSLAVSGGYDAIDALLDGDINARDLEELTNLFMLLNTAQMHGWLPAGAARLDERREQLCVRLQPLANRRSHPTDSAWARTHLLQLGFLADPSDTDVHAALITGLNALLRDVDKLPEYPVESLCEVISVYTQLPFDISGLDEVADRAGALIGQRAGAQAEARQLVDRATDKLRKGAAEQAIRLIGRAWGKLHRQKSRDLYLESAWVATQAYCDVGLFCAARAHLILALNRSWRALVEDAEVSVDTLSLALRLVWVELGAGRLPLLLDALRVADVVAGALDLSEKAREAYSKERGEIEVLLVRAIASSQREDMEVIRIAPALFHQRQLYLAEQASLVLLGHPEDDEFHALTGGTTFAEIQTLPMPEDLSPIDWSAGDSLTLRTQMMGCEFHASGIETKEARSLILSLFAAMEGFVATGFADNFVPMIDKVRIAVDDSLQEPTLSVEVEEDDCGEPLIRVRYARGTLSSCAATSSFINRAASGVVVIVGNVCAPGTRSDLERMFRIDAVQDRAFSLLHSCVMDDAEADGRPFLNALLMNDVAPCDVIDGGRFLEAKANVSPQVAWNNKKFHAGEDAPFKPVFHHQRTRLASVINMRLWDRAGWCGIAFRIQPETTTPYFDLIFRDGAAAAKILRGLRRRIGSGDPDDILRIAVLTGIDKSNPAHYRVGIAPESAATFDDGAQTMIFVVRMQAMTPNTGANLERFLELFRASGRFRLGAAVLNGNQGAAPMPVAVEPIEFRRLDLKATWQIGAEDPLFTIILQPEDDPYIPTDVERPDELAVHKILSARRKKRRS